VASNPSLDLTLTPLHGDARTIGEWMTTFHLASVVLDPYTNESSWVLKTAARVLDSFRGAAVRVNFVLTCTASEAEQFLGPYADQFLVFPDPDRAFVRSLGLQMLPAFVFLRIDGTVQDVAEGWDAIEWRRVADRIATATAWSRPALPVPGDPGPFHGTPALA
jgi:hypothetical protein